MFAGVLSASSERISRQTICHPDRSLLTRILGNMVQNVVEASRPDEPVRISCKVQNGDVEFQVHNERYKGITPILALMESMQFLMKIFPLCLEVL